MLGVLTLISINSIMQGFQVKFISNILKISPTSPSSTSSFGPRRPSSPATRMTLLATHVTHEVPSDRQLRINRPAEIVRALERMDGVVAAAGSVVGSAVLAIGTKEYPVDLRGIRSSASRLGDAYQRVCGEGDLPLPRCAPGRHPHRLRRGKSHGSACGRHGCGGVSRRRAPELQDCRHLRSGHPAGG